METKIENFHYFKIIMVLKNLLPSSRKAPFYCFIFLKQIKWIENPSHKRERQRTKDWRGQPSPHHTQRQAMLVSLSP
jgi:hypothetical protein